MEIILNIIETTLNSFDFTYCIIVNILTYLIIRIINDNGNRNISRWNKRLVLLLVILLTGIVYYFIGSDIKTTLNSAILAPVFWSWVLKPICNYFNVDYKDINMVD